MFSAMSRAAGDTRKAMLSTCNGGRVLVQCAKDSDQVTKVSESVRETVRDRISSLAF
jgi:hypothetical protein